MTTNSEPLRLGGVSEVAAELNVSRQQVAKLRQRDDFPLPVANLTVGDIWDLDMVRRWRNSGLRRAAGRPAANAQRRAAGRRFELMAEIGGGGFAVVYSARDFSSPSDIEVAVKVLREVHALDPEIVARFERELKLMSGLRDPHVMPVLASGTDEKLGLWYAMPLALGSLADELGNMGEDHILTVMREVCAGLAYIHGRGILHRDLKPENVLRTDAGTWAIADLGLARAVAETSVRLTASAEAMGTAFYTAPEQWKDAKRVDERADIYSAGKILQALVTGGPPVDDDVPSGKLRAVIQRAISQDPRRRYASAADLLAAIEAAVAVLAEGKWETPQDKAYRLRRRLREGGAADEGALEELTRWAEEVDSADHDDMEWFAWTLSSLSRDSVDWWWDRDPAGFTRVFLGFTERMDGSFDFGACDVFADFARCAVTATRDTVILREAVRGLACLGYNHNRWHVRDVVVAILQGIRNDEDAGAALEGLRMAGIDAARWTIGDTVIRTLQSQLRGGLYQFLEADAE
jgi:tRNA A-37 threonylcarbamoyl transferase component Bud32